MSIRTASVRYLWPLAASLVVLLVSVGLACGRGGGTEGTIAIIVATTAPTTAPAPTPTPTPTPIPTPTPSPNVCGTNPDPAPASVLQVQEPQPGERVKTPFHVRGWGSEIGLEDKGVIMALIDASGEPFPPLEVPPQRRELVRIPPPGLKITDFTAPFAADIQVPDLRSPTPFCIWVFLATTSDGVPKQVAQVPVVVTP